MQFDAIVLAGGEGRRLGGLDKAQLEVGGASLLERALAALRAARLTIIVGPRRTTTRTVMWTREQPTGGGPVAATATGLRQVTAATVVVLAVDYPFVDEAVVSSLLEAIGDLDGAALVDAGGRLHLVVGAYRTESLRSALATPDADASMQGALAALRVARVHNDRAAFDVDTTEDLHQARSQP